jgi:DNA-binding PadR family transcriptional regulator
MSAPHVLLGLLEERPRHGYDLKREYDRRFGAGRPLQFGQVYSTLGRLHRDGRVAVAGVEVAEGPERTAYAITRDGIADLERWLGEPVPPAPYLQSVLFTKVMLALLSGRPAAGVLDRQRAAHLVVMRQLTAGKRGSDLPTALRADFALFHLEADLRWIELTGARLDSLAQQLKRS